MQKLICCHETHFVLEQFGDWQVLSPAVLLQKQSFKHMVVEVRVVLARSDAVW